MCHWHALPESWHEMEYQDFLAVRRKAIAGVIREGFLLLRSTAAGTAGASEMKSGHHSRDGGRL